MTMTIRTRTDDRKAMVKQISEHLQLEAIYQGPPTFAYTIGLMTVDRDGAITCEEDGTLGALKPFLAEKGYIAAEIETLEITTPIEGMDGNQLRNLMYMLYGYQYLLNRVTRRENFFIADSVVERLREQVPESAAYFEALVKDFRASGDLAGVDFKAGTVTLDFPLEESPEKNKAYADLLCAIVKASREAKRVSAEKHCPENEKYVLRSWLLRLGFGGADFKASRNALLNGLKGHTAFPNDASANRHKAKYAEIRKIARELRDGDGA